MNIPTSPTIDAGWDVVRVQGCGPIVELRQIELLDREFVESREAVGMKVLGQFLDLDNPNRFVWLRGFRDMPSRALALKEFYGGPVWKAHREAANTTMIDSDNVLLLRPGRLSKFSRLMVKEAHSPMRDTTEKAGWSRSKELGNRPMFINLEDSNRKGEQHESRSAWIG